MPKIIEGQLVSEGRKYGIIVSRFNEFISSKLLGGALDALARHGVQDNEITVVWTPGSYEIPVVAKKMALSGDYDAVITLGAVIRGGTPHFEYVASETNKGIARVSLDTGIPIIQGIITADTLEQAIERAGAKEGNRGFAAASSAIEMANLMKNMQS